MKKAGVVFPRTVLGVFAGPVSPETAIQTLRLSTVLRMLRMDQKVAEADALDADAEAYGKTCTVHGRIEDPIIGILRAGHAPRIAFACPDCSGADVRAAYEKEGKSK